MSISVCILNYNGKDLIERCVRCVEKQSQKIDELLIVDNASTDNSWKLVEKHVSRVVHCDNRHKFISGLNDSFNEAKEDHICFLENDVFLHEECIEDMYTLAKYEAIVSPQFYDKDGFRYKEEKFSGFLTACFMMKKSTFEFVGEFDENLAPAYWEDVDYTIRARRMGFSTMKGVGKAIHWANFSFSKVFSKNQMGGWCRRNALYLLKKHYISRVAPFLHMK